MPHYRALHRAAGLLKSSQGAKRAGIIRSPYKREPPFRGSKMLAHPLQGCPELSVSVDMTSADLVSSAQRLVNSRKHTSDSGLWNWPRASYFNHKDLVDLATPILGGPSSQVTAAN